MTHKAQSQSSDARLAGFVYRFIPAQDAAKSVETFLLLHGTGGDENDLLSLGQMLAGGRRDVALPATLTSKPYRHPRRLPDFGQRQVNPSQMLPIDNEVQKAS